MGSGYGVSQEQEYKLAIEGIKDSDDLTFLKPFTRHAEDRPVVGNLILTSEFPLEEFKVIRTIPANNPDNQSVTYVIAAVIPATGSQHPFHPVIDFGQYYLDMMSEAGGDSWAFQKG